jgi:hypothetical protein
MEHRLCLMTWCQVLNIVQATNSDSSYYDIMQIYDIHFTVFLHDVHINFTAGFCPALFKMSI